MAALNFKFFEVKCCNQLALYSIMCLRFGGRWEGEISPLSFFFIVSNFVEAGGKITKEISHEGEEAHFTF